MKELFTLIGMIAGVFLSGCATGENGPVPDAVAPPMSQSPAAMPANGNLVVYSACEANADFNARDPDRPEYSDYKIFDTDGKLLQKVHNNSGTMLQDPVQMALPPGKYLIKARANGYGLVTIPVIIAAQQDTVLHLEGGGAWTDKPKFNRTNIVCLPDGESIGWKAASGL